MMNKDLGVELVQYLKYLHLRDSINWASASKGDRTVTYIHTHTRLILYMHT